MQETNEEFYIISKEDEIEFKKLATGRKFCKKGESISDICDEEITRYNYEKSFNILKKFFQHRKYKKKTEKILLEKRSSSCIRAMAYKYIRDEENTNREQIINKVKSTILEAIEDFKQKNKNNVIDIKTKKEA